MLWVLPTNLGVIAATVNRTYGELQDCITLCQFEIQVEGREQHDLKEAGHDQVRKVGDPHWAALRLPSVFSEGCKHQKLPKGNKVSSVYSYKLLYVSKKIEFLFDHSVMSIGIGNGIAVRIGN